MTYPKFGELLQGLSTEIAIAKDHEMNELDRKLIALYDEALEAYKFSAALWQRKIEAHDDHWKGEIDEVWLYTAFTALLAASMRAAARPRRPRTPPHSR